MNYCLIYDVFETGAIAAGTLIAGELLLDLRYLRNVNLTSITGREGELLPGLRYIRNADLVMSLSIKGELLLGLPYLRNEWNAPRLSVKVNYYLDYGTSET